MPYTQLRSKSETAGMYCRNVPMRQPGSKIVPGIELMGREGKNGMAMATTTYLTASFLPRCLDITMKGSHFAIATADTKLGADDVKRVYAYSPMEMGTDDAHCVYATFKPRCVTYSKPTTAYRVIKGMKCHSRLYKSTCFDQCYAIHCADTTSTACGKSKAFQDCARCCGRRRRLGAAAAAITEGKNMKGEFTPAECAMNCLNDIACIAWNNDDGACRMTDHCDQAMDLESTGADGWEQASWAVWKSMTAKDLSSNPPAKKDKSKKRRKKKKSAQ